MPRISAFDTFLDQELAGEPSPAMDWEDKKTRWLQALHRFYVDLESFLQPYVAQAKLQIAYNTIMIEEEFIGRYQARCAQIMLGSHVLRLEPIGTNLIAAQGRVDLVGPCGTVKFVLVDAASKGPRMTVSPEDEQASKRTTETQPKHDLVWKIATQPPNIHHLPLVQESFYDAIMQVTQG
jgi:hypothetical protein